MWYLFFKVMGHYFLPHILMRNWGERKKRYFGLDCKIMKRCDDIPASAAVEVDREAGRRTGLPILVSLVSPSCLFCFSGMRFLLPVFCLRQFSGIQTRALFRARALSLIFEKGPAASLEWTPFSSQRDLNMVSEFFCFPGSDEPLVWSAAPT